MLRKVTDVAIPSLPRRWHFAIGVGLLVAAVYLDISKPFHRSWSVSYLLPAFYAAWTLRGKLGAALVAASNLALFLTPTMVDAGGFWLGGGYVNRSAGGLLANLLIGLLWERRRYIHALQTVNEELEWRVRDRTAELEQANEFLRKEVAERQKAQAEQKELEEQLRQAQKMEAIGQLAGGIAHDFNNLLTVINGYSSMLVELVPSNSSWHQPLQEVCKAGDRAAELTQQLLAFSRKQMRTPKVISINQAITTAESLLRRTLPEHIHIHLDLNPNVQPILADAGQLVQVLLNLASNARDAMPKGGEFRIVTQQAILAEDELAGADLRPGPHIRWVVSDTGNGMDETTQRHIFEPFFTTKQVGKGTGLGLASVYGIIKQSGGQIDVTSEPGRGTSFIIHLPCAASASLPTEERQPLSPALLLGKEAILLVEDDAAVRDLAAAVLREAGYHVIEAGTGQEALSMATGDDAPYFELLITDVVMPEMDGPKLATLLMELRPNLSVLFVTGYSKTDCSPEIIQPESLLEKPFDARSLLTKVRQVLQSGQSSRRREEERRLDAA